MCYCGRSLITFWFIPLETKPINYSRQTFHEFINNILLHLLPLSCFFHYYKELIDADDSN